MAVASGSNGGGKERRVCEKGGNVFYFIYLFRCEKGNCYFNLLWTFILQIYNFICLY